MKHSLQLRLSQHLTLTPQLQQSIRLLQLSTQELDQEIERFLRDNPLLEREDSTAESFAATARMADAASHTTERSSPDNGAPDPAAGSSNDDNQDSRERSDSDILSELSYSASRERDDRDSDDGDYPQAAAETPSLREHLLHVFD